jgi:hypothetical protein
MVGWVSALSDALDLPAVASARPGQLDGTMIQGAPLVIHGLAEGQDLTDDDQLRILSLLSQPGLGGCGNWLSRLPSHVFTAGCGWSRSHNFCAGPSGRSAFDRAAWDAAVTGGGNLLENASVWLNGKSRAECCAYFRCRYVLRCARWVRRS